MKLRLAVFLLALAPLARAQDADPPEVSLGERLFLETRFAQFFAANSGGDVNRPLGNGGDPALAETETTGAPLPGPFAGQAMNCRACHLVDEQLQRDASGLPDLSVGGMRSYADFARRSPIPARPDGRTHTPRNSPPLVNATLPRKVGLELHFDGEFASLVDLVKETLVGRNYGWLPTERKQAVAQIAHVIRQDDGRAELANEYGGSYRRVLAGTDPNLPEDLVLPPILRLNVDKANDTQIVNEVAKLIARYVESLEFSKDSTGAFSASPYDLFLLRNNLPRRPKGRETAAQYSQRLEAALDALPTPLFVAEIDGPFALHAEPFRFDAQELEGLRIFLRTQGSSSVGNCVACHPAPDFTDFVFHNTGVTQREYDGVHGAGAFAALEIPSRSDRLADPNAFLPPTAKHPFATGRFRAAADAGDPDLADLGVWNVFMNSDFPRPQSRLKRMIQRTLTGKVTKDELLDAAIARFKTPGLRDLGHSDPYLHDGSADTRADVIGFYAGVASLQRAGALRNGDPELAKIQLSGADVAPLVAFLQALDEDYQ
ncbi:MAG TPA: hypothetical protein VMR31_10910 [Myxococcota bacterium]|nr:hypothetical protein [Myxococcota bacterium]